MREHFDVLPFEHGHFPPPAVRQGLKEKDRVVIGGGRCHAARSGAGEDSRNRRRIPRSHKTADNMHRIIRHARTVSLRAARN